MTQAKRQLWWFGTEPCDQNRPFISAYEEHTYRRPEPAG